MSDFGPIWQYTREDRRVVVRMNEDGSIESHLVTVPMIQEWIAAGNEPLPPPAPRPAS